MSDAKPVAEPGPDWPSPDALSFAMLVLLGIGFGALFALNRLATTNGVPVVPYVFWQSLGASVVLLAICAVVRQWPSLGFAHLKVYLVMGALNVVIPYSVLSLVAPKVPSGVLSLGLALVPVMIYGLALPLRLDRFRWLRLAGILLGLLGVLLVLVPKASLPSPGMAGWLALGLIAPLSFALRAVLIPLLRPPATKTLPLACGLLIAASVIMALVMVARGEIWLFDGRFGTGHWATIAAMADNAVVFVVLYELIRRAGPVFFGTVNYIAIVVAVGLGLVIFADRHSAWIWIAIALVFAGMYLVNRRGPSTPARG